MGYAGACAAGVAGHFYVVSQLLNPKSPKNKQIFKMTYGIAGFGLVFSFIGTVLGGIWADQSWGVFGAGTLKKTELYSLFFGLVSYSMPE